ncbi:GNAT family N-acetyltransferase [Agromyces bracchium]|uniref:GNAT family N-acetyltransferase n=1 Tax=Agromyces bracchium TaxID=88376 RepID=A0A6I3LYS7_9MICO|nr:GNAT family N-acetyltransferase [Agromyces bracchium]MTH67690.1 GNAT family N-acetyltransferase [Agromyces bracchium]
MSDAATPADGAAAPDDAAPTLRVVSASTVPFADVEAVFGTRGDPATCWCQWYKLRGSQWESATRDELRGRLEEQLAAPGTGPGIIAYDGETPVGWCAIEPRSGLERLRHSPVASASPDDDFDDPSIWAVTCFVVPRAHRRRGVGRALAAAAVETARAHGASLLEAYAVDPTARTKPPAADLFPGTVSMFEAAGFSEVARPKPHRVVMQHPLG